MISSSGTMMRGLLPTNESPNSNGKYLLPMQLQYDTPISNDSKSYRRVFSIHCLENEISSSIKSVEEKITSSSKTPEISPEYSKKSANTNEVHSTPPKKSALRNRILTPLFKHFLE